MARGIDVPKDLRTIMNDLTAIGGGVTDQPQNLIPSVGKAGANASGVISDAGNVADFLSRLDDANTWVRIGEFAIGAILIYVGVRSLFPNQVGAVTGTVKTAAAVGALA